MAGKAFDMEQTHALITCLFIFSATIKWGITQGTSDFYRCWVCTIKMGESRKVVERGHMRSNRSQSQDSLVHC